jgi:hypothetical protein
MELDLRTPARRHAPTLSFDPKFARAARATWRGRMVNEYMSAAVFERLALQMAEAGFSTEEVDECRSFASEERMHGVLCGAVVEALGGDARASVSPRRPLPQHEDVSRREAVVRNFLSVSCLSETVAVALIGAERIEMPEGALRDLLTRIWSDEIGHARLGWSIVSRSVRASDAATRARLDRYLAVAFAHFEDHELQHLPLGPAPSPEGTALGLCSGSDARALLYGTVAEVILPELEQIGLRAGEAWRARRALSSHSALAVA